MPTWVRHHAIRDRRHERTYVINLEAAFYFQLGQESGRGNFISIDYGASAITVYEDDDADAYRLIAAYGSLDTREAIVKVVSSQLQLRIRVNGSSVQVGVRGEGFNSYLALEPDGFPLHSLDDLPSC